MCCVSKTNIYFLKSKINNMDTVPTLKVDSNASQGLNRLIEITNGVVVNLNTVNELIVLQTTCVPTLTLFWLMRIKVLMANNSIL